MVRVSGENRAYWLDSMPNFKIMFFIDVYLKLKVGASDDGDNSH